MIKAVATRSDFLRRWRAKFDF